MSGEDKSQLNNQSKFRFLNPEEKKKLKEIKDEILGESKNINFESNVDLAIQFAPRSYDTQRYSIKKLVDERLANTLVFNSSEVRNKVNVEEVEEFEDIEIDFDELDDFEDIEIDFDEIEETPKAKMIVTSVERNVDVDDEFYEDGEIVNERLEEQTAIIQRELERILRANSRFNDSEEVEKIFKEKQLLNLKELNHIETKFENESPQEVSTNRSDVPKFVDELTTMERRYLEDVQTLEDSRKRELVEEKKKRARELFEGNDDDFKDESYFRVRKNNHKYIYYLLVALLIGVIVFIAFQILDSSRSDNDQDFESSLEVDESSDEEKVDTYSVGELVPPETEESISTYIGTVEILNSNNVNEVAEIVNGSFEYVEGSNETEYFDEAVYANLKNAKPYKDINNLIVLFGKDDNDHFGNLKYLEDSDYYNSIEVNYENEGVASTYKAISYYQTEELDKRLYGAFGDIDFINFITDEIYKSIHEVRSDIIIDMDSELLTLVTFDSEEKLYHVLYLMKFE